MPDSAAHGVFVSKNLKPWSLDKTISMSKFQTMKIFICVFCQIVITKHIIFIIYILY